MKTLITSSLLFGFLAASSLATAADSVQEIYDSKCSACHISGVAGAPKLDDKAAWTPRLEKGMEALLASVKNGLGAMPPTGTCAECTDEDLAALIELMTAGVK